MLSVLPRATFTALASSPTLKRLANRYAMRRAGRLARRFIAGETVTDAIGVARALERDGLSVTLDLLATSARSPDQAMRATRAYVETLGEIERSGIDRNISVKLAQLGLHVDRATCIDNLRRIVDAATPGDFFVRIDMERSRYTEQTLDAFETLWSIGYCNVGVVMPSYLRRAESYVRRLNSLGARVRLVKGAYHEPREVALQHQADVDAVFIELTHLLLREGTYPAIATHDPALVSATRQFAAANGIGLDTFEFQMMYGVRRDLQAMLLRAGHRLRVYVPFGQEWFPYFMRRLGEHPAYLGSLVRNLASF
jgi:proline dehydrogenase